MAVLHRLRSPGPRGLIRRATVARTPSRSRLGPAVALAAVVFLPVACGDAGEPVPAPPEILRDSLGLTAASQFAEVTLRHEGGREVVDPDTIRTRPGRYVSFRSGDHWPRRVAFAPEGLGAEQREFLAASGILESPPLIRADARWVVETTGAPLGSYPFVVSGPGPSGTGVLILESPSSR